jgi:hypothetical protein
MSEKIEQWRLFGEDNDSWKGEMNVTLNEYDLKILVSALNSSSYEGVIAFEERDYLLNKLNISL